MELEENIKKIIEFKVELENIKNYKDYLEQEIQKIEKELDNKLHNEIKNNIGVTRKKRVRKPYHMWTTTEEAQIYDLVSKGNDYKKIAIIMNLDKHKVQQRIWKINRDIQRRKQYHNSVKGE